MKRVLAKLEHYRKAVVALVSASAGVYGVIEKADLSTREGVFAALFALLAVAGVYVAPNKPKPDA